MSEDDLQSLHPNVQWIVAEARRSVALDPRAKALVLEAIRAEPRPRRQARFLRWLAEPRIVLPPVAALAMAAGLVGIGVVAGLTYHRDGRGTTVQSPAVAADPQLPATVAPRVVKFVLIAPQAARVSVVGDFNAWDPSRNPAERQADGSWTTFVPLLPGRHEYSFVLDGTHFVKDPTAPLAPDDGFGQSNSVIVVAGASS